MKLRPRNPWRWLAALPALGLVGLVLALPHDAACGCPRSVATGTVAGILQLSTVSTPTGEPGSVTLTSGSGQTYTVRVPFNGMFTTEVAVGSYTAVGYSPLVLSDGVPLRCMAQSPVVVVPGKTTQVTVTCLGF